MSRGTYRTTLVRPEFSAALGEDFFVPDGNGGWVKRALAGMVLEVLRQLPPLTKLKSPNTGRDASLNEPVGADSRMSVFFTTDDSRPTGIDVVRAVSLESTGKLVMAVDNLQANSLTLITEETAHATRSREYPLATAEGIQVARLAIAAAAGGIYNNRPDDRR